MKTDNAQYEYYTIDPVKLYQNDKGEDVMEDAKREEANEFILMGHWTATHGVDISEAIFAAPTFDSCSYMYERITGRDYKDGSK